MRRRAQRELGAVERQLIVALEPVPIGSATIAQVHRATLRVGGADVEAGGAADVQFDDDPVTAEAAAAPATDDLAPQPRFDPNTGQQNWD